MLLHHPSLFQCVSPQSTDTPTQPAYSHPSHCHVLSFCPQTPFSFCQLSQWCHFFLSCPADNSGSCVAFSGQVSPVSFDLEWLFGLSLSFRTLSGMRTGLLFCRVGHPWVCLIPPPVQTQAVYSWQESCRNDAVHWAVVSYVTVGDVSHHLWWLSMFLTTSMMVVK